VWPFVLQSAVDDPGIYIETRITSFDYTSIEPSELSFGSKEIIFVIKKDPSGWWTGKVNKDGRIGIFPENYTSLREKGKNEKEKDKDKDNNDQQRTKGLKREQSIKDTIKSVAQKTKQKLKRKSLKTLKNKNKKHHSTNDETTSKSSETPNRNPFPPFKTSFFDGSLQDDYLNELEKMEFQNGYSTKQNNSDPNIDTNTVETTNNNISEGKTSKLEKRKSKGSKESYRSSRTSFRSSRTNLGYSIENSFNVFVQLFNESMASGTQLPSLSTLSSISPKHCSFSICTNQGKFFSYGDYKQPFPLRTCVWPFFYALLSEYVEESTILQWIDKEVLNTDPDELLLNSVGIPHNPFVPSGAITSIGLLLRYLLETGVSNPVSALELVLMYLGNLAGRPITHFLPSLILEQQDGKCKQLATYLEQNDALPKDILTSTILSLFLQINNIAATTKSLSIMASILANNGVSPLTKNKLIKDPNNLISLISQVGLNGTNSDWRDNIGYPAITSSTGSMFVVIPGCMGLAIYSPLIDETNISVKAVNFCKLIKYHFGDFSNFISS